VGDDSTDDEFEDEDELIELDGHHVDEVYEDEEDVDEEELSMQTYRSR
jgi:hypothetical protein